MVNMPLSIIVSLVSVASIVCAIVLAIRERKTVPPMVTLHSKDEISIPEELEFPACTLPVLDLTRHCMVCHKDMGVYDGARLCSLRCMSTLEEDLGMAS